MTDASPADRLIAIEAVCATPERQQLVQVNVPAGTTARQALSFTGLAKQFPELDLESGPLGIFGRVVAGDTVLQSGDRVEVYRPLLMDPREARRRRAASKAKQGSAAGN